MFYRSVSRRINSRIGCLSGRGKNMPRQPSHQNSNALQRYLNNVREYIGRCFGIDDPEACYARQITECEKKRMRHKNQISDSPRIRAERKLCPATSFEVTDCTTPRRQVKHLALARRRRECVIKSACDLKSEQKLQICNRCISECSASRLTRE